ncbi:MAG TPA: hypothetical protein EYG94_07465 [Campylobacterales bacterium]|nr:hypothetical protein [Campylobacterales bacterium]
MKVVSSLVLIMVFFLACSQKVISSNPECRKLENKLIKLKEEKRLNLAGKIGNVLVNGYPHGMDGTILNQNIKVLEMKLNDCNRK